MTGNSSQSCRHIDVFEAFSRLLLRGRAEQYIIAIDIIYDYTFKLRLIYLNFYAQKGTDDVIFFLRCKTPKNV